MIRAANPDDLALLAEVERAAGGLFRSLGMDVIADYEPPSVSHLSVFERDGRAWVATTEADDPVGYLLVGTVDGNAHIEQVSVHPSHARKGLGRKLIEVAEDWARARDLAALTLTTYADVPWNAPYYERLGFEVLDEEEQSAGLRRIREHEVARGLAAWPRVTMRRAVRPGGTPDSPTGDPLVPTSDGPEAGPSVERLGQRRGLQGGAA